MDFFIPICVALAFFIAKYVEMRYIDKEPKPLKYMVRDTILVFLITAATIFIYASFHDSIHDFMNVITNTKTVPTLHSPEIFTDTPGF
jgi:hypothetical protein